VKWSSIVETCCPPARPDAASARFPCRTIRPITCGSFPLPSNLKGLAANGLDQIVSSLLRGLRSLRPFDHLIDKRNQKSFMVQILKSTLWELPFGNTHNRAFFAMRMRRSPVAS
jgi:hypothetical protein